MNFRVWIDKLENENLKRALYLRMERKFSEALESLNQACKEGDGNAWFFKARAYRLGGWTLLENEQLYGHCLEEARKVNCPWTYQNGCGDAYGRGLWYKNANEKDLAELKFVEAHALGNPLATLELYLIHRDYKILESVVAFGDEYTQFVYFSSIGEKRLRCELAETKFNLALYDVGNALYASCEYLKFTEFVIANKLMMDFDDCVKVRNKSSQNLRELFCYGRAVKLYTSNFCYVGHRCYDRANRIYKESSDRAKAATLCFVGLRLLPKDMRRMIGELVWCSRFDPAVWGVKL